MRKKYLIVLFVIGLSLIAGFFVFNSLKQKDKSQSQFLSDQSDVEGLIKSPQSNFAGEKGSRVSLIDGQVAIDSEVFSDNLVHYYNVKLPGGKTIYFFILKDKEGIYRAAANACQVCFGSGMGFRQEDDFMVCNTCGNKYPLEKVATEKGGCNPGPISSNLKVENGEIIISQLELEQVSGLF